MALDRPPSETETLEDLLKKGEQLVDEYQKIKKWKNFYKRPGYTTKLIEFDNSLNKHLSTLQVQILSEVMKISVTLQDGNAAKTAEKNDVVLPGQIDARKDFWEEFTVGLEVPLEDLKMELRKDDRPVLVLTAPAGYGKTTLAQKLCRDPEIQGTILIMLSGNNDMITQVLVYIYIYFKSFSIGFGGLSVIFAQKEANNVYQYA